MSQGFQILSAGQRRFGRHRPGSELENYSGESNARRSGADRKFKPLFAFTVYDLDGKPIVEGDEVALEPGQTRSFEIPYIGAGRAGWARAGADRSALFSRHHVSRLCGRTGCPRRVGNRRCRQWQDDGASLAEAERDCRRWIRRSIRSR